MISSDEALFIDAGCLPSQGNQGKVREIDFHQKRVREIREKHGKSGKVREIAS